MSVSENEKKKRAFRNTKAWKTFRHSIFVRDKGKDYITGKKLLKGYECHHLDLDKENYKKLDEENFLCLNKLSHKFIHWIYPLYIKDENVVERFIEVLNKMKHINGDDLERR